MEKLGKVLMTQKITDHIEKINFKMAVNSALTRFSRKDWGDVSEATVVLNNEELIKGEQVLGVYPSTMGKIWLVANFYEKEEMERIFKETVGSEREDGLVMVVTVMFPSEY